MAQREAPTAAATRWHHGRSSTYSHPETAATMTVTTALFNSFDRAFAHLTKTTNTATN